MEQCCYNEAVASSCILLSILELMTLGNSTGLGTHSTIAVTAIVQLRFENMVLTACQLP
jgi:hypothetical protein